MERHLLFYLVLLVKGFVITQTASVYNRSSLRNSIIVIKKNPYGDIIIKSETVNLNSTDMFDDTATGANHVHLNDAFNISNEYMYDRVGCNCSEYSKESIQDSNYTFNQSMYNLTNCTNSTTTQNTTKRRSILRRLFDKLLWQPWEWLPMYNTWKQNKIHSNV